MNLSLSYTSDHILSQSVSELFLCGCAFMSVLLDTVLASSGVPMILSEVHCSLRRLLKRIDGRICELTAEMLIWMKAQWFVGDECLDVFLLIF